MNQPPVHVSRRDFVKFTITAVGATGLHAVLGGCDDHSPKPTQGLGTRFEYDIKKYSQIDPSLYGYGLHRTLRTDLVGARSLAIAGGTTAVAIGRRVLMITDEHDAWLELPAPVTAVSLSDDAMITIAMSDSVELRSLAALEQVIKRWSIPEGKPFITCSALRGDNIFIADAGNRIVWRFDRSGQLINRIGDADVDRSVPGFVIPSPLFDLAIDPDGQRLWVANTGRHRLEAYDFDGNPTGHWGTASMGISGFCGCCNPCHFVLLPDGRFITSEKGIPRIKRHDSAGAMQCVVAGPERFGVQGDALNRSTPASRLGGPLLAIDASHRVVTVHPALGELLVFAASPTTPTDTTTF